MKMTLDDLLVAVQATTITPELITQMEERLRIAEVGFEKDRQRKEADPQGFLRREYTI